MEDTVALQSVALLVDELTRALGPDRIDCRTEARHARSHDLTEADAVVPDVIVRADTVEHVAAAIRLARARGVAVTPMVANFNLGGLAVPERGGIVLDLSGMNRILEVNDRDLYKVIEPGVTWAQVRAELDARHPAARFGWATAPPESSVLANCLLDGQTNLGVRFGTTGAWINGVEAVLGTGDVVRTGAAAFGGPWSANVPLPDLTGLFINTHGTVGIVTKLSVQLWPARKHRRRYLLPVFDTPAMCDALTALAREDLCDEIVGFSSPLPKMILGVDAPERAAPGEPCFYAGVELWSNSLDDLRHKDRLMRQLLRSPQWSGAFRVRGYAKTRLGVARDERHRDGIVGWSERLGENLRNDRAIGAVGRGQDFRSRELHRRLHRPKASDLGPSHRRPDIFENPGAFVPERFESRTYSPFESYPFGGGNRRCVGASFAMLHMKVMLSTLMKTVTFRRHGSTRLRVQQRGATLGPSRRLRLTVEAVHR